MSALPPKADTALAGLLCPGETGFCCSYCLKDQPRGRWGWGLLWCEPSPPAYLRSVEKSATNVCHVASCRSKLAGMIEATQRKLREAKFFYQRLHDLPHPNHEQESFRFYLSAFLSAAISVTDALSFEGKRKYRIWKPKWRKNLTPAENTLEKFVYKLRVDEVHLKGVELAAKLEEIAFNDLLGLQTRSPYIQPQVGTPERQPRPVMVGRLSRYFETEDDRAEVLTVCKLYTAYLDKLVGDFLKAHPETR
jgi:hypothetical protein